MGVLDDFPEIRYDNDGINGALHEEGRRMGSEGRRPVKLSDVAEFVPPVPGEIQRRTTRGVSPGEGDPGIKLQALTLPEIRQMWADQEVDFSTDPEILKIGGSLRKGNILNAFALYCLSRPREERRRIIMFGLRALEALKDLKQPLDLRRLSSDAFSRLGGDFAIDDAAARPDNFGSGVGSSDEAANGGVDERAPKPKTVAGRNPHARTPQKHRGIR